jgi:hypothetical protein
MNLVLEEGYVTQILVFVRVALTFILPMVMAVQEPGMTADIIRVLCYCKLAQVLFLVQVWLYCNSLMR